MVAAQRFGMLRRWCLLFFICLLLYWSGAVLAAPEAPDSQDLEGAVQVLPNSTRGSAPNLLTSKDAQVIRARGLKHRNRKLLPVSSCRQSDISIYQGRIAPTPEGIPSFAVEIFNLCNVNCSLSDIHVSCGGFASAKVVAPKTFRRLRYGDCLVNDGKPLKAGGSVYFQYANSREYPLEVKSAKGCRGS